MTRYDFKGLMAFFHVKEYFSMKKNRKQVIIHEGVFFFIIFRMIRKSVEKSVCVFDTSLLYQKLHVDMKKTNVIGDVFFEWFRCVFLIGGIEKRHPFD